VIFKQKFLVNKFYIEQDSDPVLFRSLIRIRIKIVAGSATLFLFDVILGCGKGGDLLKWYKVGATHVVGLGTE
jgi:hypothetical protein